MGGYDERGNSFSKFVTKFWRSDGGRKEALAAAKTRSRRVLNGKFKLSQTQRYSLLNVICEMLGSSVLMVTFKPAESISGKGWASNVGTTPDC